MIKVYIKVDNDNNIVDINSSIFLKDTTGYICIDEGIGDKYAHAQNNYLKTPLRYDNGQYSHKYINNKIEYIPDSNVD